MFQRKVKFYIVLLVVSLSCAGLAVWDLCSPPEPLFTSNSGIAFSHRMHGDTLGLDCAKCHSGARISMRAFMPSKADCMDCHNLPLTDKPGIETLDSLLAKAPAEPFRMETLLPDHVIFHHGVHAKAGVSCETCHGSVEEIDKGRRAEVKMQKCLYCHNGNQGFPKAATDCARCHR
ncbi:MAG: cytochrome c3 family protein [Fibrobacteraceae bacterium]|nr:cytochrome c3 family protein [Fibrobacteraceae bacterium]